VEGRMRMMNHNLKFENYEENEYFYENHVADYYKIHSNITGMVYDAITEGKYCPCSIFCKLPIVFEEILVSVFQLFHHLC
jgi:hypothetical protein